MEALIQQAFLHVDVIGQHVAEGHYDLVGPNGDIIPPQLWETVVEPDWTITMHMWPAPEKPKSPDPPIILDDNSDQFSTSLVQIVGSRLTYLAVVFLPLTYVSGVFSMEGDTAL